MWKIKCSNGKYVQKTTYGMLFSGVLNEVTFDNLSTLIENHLDIS